MGDAEAKKVTLAKALAQTENRQVAKILAAFVIALAIIPVVGLIVTERLLRSIVQDEATRWTCSGITAVVLVNVVAGAYVMVCFYEDQPEHPGSRHGKKHEGEQPIAEPGKHEDAAREGKKDR